MSGERDEQRPEDPTQAYRKVRLEELARSLGPEDPFFDAPLTAFIFGGEQYPEGPVFLGGDLHAVHPSPAEERSRSVRDRKLDNSSIVLGDPDREPLRAGAVEGIWCLALPDDLAASSLPFFLYDGEDRLRAWLCLPPARQMIGVGHLWLPSVPPLPGQTTASAEGPSTGA
jgi:hypothetical protein